MVASFTSLAVIAAIAFIGPFIAQLFPGKWVQSSAIILLLGAVCGPNLLGWIDTSAPGMDLVKQIGLAFLFLMGGYELDPQAVLGRRGRHAQVSWLVSLVLAILLVWLIPFDLTMKGTLALAISLTSTTYGKVSGVLKVFGERDSKFGQVVTSYGATGELLPVVAIALLLSDGEPHIELGAIVAFILLALVIVAVINHEERGATKISLYLHESNEAQSGMVRLIVAILMALVAVGVTLGADMIVAGFAAGFVMRRLVPPTNHEVLERIQGIANGFFIPCVFVLSGATVSIPDGLREPLVVLSFIALLLVIRGLPVFVGLYADKETRGMDKRQKLSVAMYSCMAMSTVVAMTGVAVDAGDMTQHIASTVVFAAALMTIIVPIVVHRLLKDENVGEDPVD